MWIKSSGTNLDQARYTNLDTGATAWVWTVPSGDSYIRYALGNTNLVSYLTTAPFATPEEAEDALRSLVNGVTVSDVIS